MSSVVVFGFTGYAGGHIVDELLARGHRVTGVARTADRSDSRENLTVRSGSVQDKQFVAEVAAGADVVVSAVHSPVLAASLDVLLDVAQAVGARLGLVGGAGSLLLAEGGPRVLDVDFPEEFRAVGEEHAKILELLQAGKTSVDWFYLSPPQVFGSHAPGVRTGQYRLGDDVVVKDAVGESFISGADYAIAFVDEIENPVHHQKRFTVGY